MKTPKEELGRLLGRKSKIMRLSPRVHENMAQARRLLLDMEAFRLEFPEHAGDVMEWEVEIIEGFPGIEEP